jgi:AcrR family transcriptional regulator
MAFTPRSEETRSAILNAARKRFGAEGFERTTIRAVATDAGIDPSMVMRYYGSKDGLFAAATDVELQLPDLREVPRSRLGDALIRHWVELWEGDLAHESMIVLLRSSITNEMASKRLRDVFVAQVVRAVGAMVEDPKEAATRAGFVSSQMLGLALTRYVLKLPPVVAIDQEAIVAGVGPTIQRYLTGKIDA